VSIPSFEVDQEQEKRDTSNKKKQEKGREETYSVCVSFIVHEYKRVHKLVSKREREKRGKCANLGASPFCNQAMVSRVLVRH
jgi:hypothetical protein